MLCFICFNAFNPSSLLPSCICFFTVSIVSWRISFRCTLLNIASGFANLPVPSPTNSWNKSDVKWAFLTLLNFVIICSMSSGCIVFFVLNFSRSLSIWSLCTFANSLLSINSIGIFLPDFSLREIAACMLSGSTSSKQIILAGWIFLYSPVSSDVSWISISTSE